MHLVHAEPLTSAASRTLHLPRFQSPALDWAHLSLLQGHNRTVGREARSSHEPGIGARTFLSARICRTNSRTRMSALRSSRTAPSSGGAVASDFQGRSSSAAADVTGCRTNSRTRMSALRSGAQGAKEAFSEFFPHSMGRGKQTCKKPRCARPARGCRVQLGAREPRMQDARSGCPPRPRPHHGWHRMGRGHRRIDSEETVPVEQLNGRGRQGIGGLGPNGISLDIVALKSYFIGKNELPFCPRPCLSPECADMLLWCCSRGGAGIAALGNGQPGP